MDELLPFFFPNCALHIFHLQACSVLFRLKINRRFAPSSGNIFTHEHQQIKDQQNKEKLNRNLDLKMSALILILIS